MKYEQGVGMEDGYYHKVLDRRKLEIKWDENIEDWKTNLIISNPHGQQSAGWTQIGKPVN